VQGGRIAFWPSKDSAQKANQSRNLFTTSVRKYLLSDSSRGKHLQHEQSCISVYARDPCAQAARVHRCFSSPGIYVHSRNATSWVWAKHRNFPCKPPAHVSRYLEATTSLKDEYVAWKHGKVAHTALRESSAEKESSQYNFHYDSGCVVARQQLTVCSCCRSHEVNRGAPFWENSEGTDSQASSLLSAQALLVTWSHQSACRLMLLQESWSQQRSTLLREQ